jgi:hypothetical protein
MNLNNVICLHETLPMNPRSPNFDVLFIYALTFYSHNMCGPNKPSSGSKLYVLKNKFSSEVKWQL